MKRLCFFRENPHKAHLACLTPAIKGADYCKPHLDKLPADHKSKNLCACRSCTGERSPKSPLCPTHLEQYFYANQHKPQALVEWLSHYSTPHTETLDRLEGVQ